MADGFAKFPTTAGLPAARAVAITPSDSANLVSDAKALYIGGAGAVAVEMSKDAPGTSVIFAGVPVGTTLQIRVRKILATGTTATNIVALY